MTRVDVCVFIAALQRFNSKPASIHMKRLNALLRWIQRNPKGLHYSHIEGDLACLGLSDSAFKREDDSGHAMRGYLIGLSPCVTGHLDRMVKPQTETCLSLYLRRRVVQLQ